MSSPLGAALNQAPSPPDVQTLVEDAVRRRLPEPPGWATGNTLRAVHTSEVDAGATHTRRLQIDQRRAEQRRQHELSQLRVDYHWCRAETTRLRREVAVLEAACAAPITLMDMLEEWRGLAAGGATGFALKQTLGESAGGRTATVAATLAGAAIGSQGLCRLERKTALKATRDALQHAEQRASATSLQLRELELSW